MIIGGSLVDGIKALVEDSGLSVQVLHQTVGPFTGFYRIAVEAFAILGSIFPTVYKPLSLLHQYFLRL